MVSDRDVFGPNLYYEHIFENAIKGTSAITPEPPIDLYRKRIGGEEIKKIIGGLD